MKAFGVGALRHMPWARRVEQRLPGACRRTTIPPFCLTTEPTQLCSYKNLLSDEECDHIIGLARPHMQRSG